MKSNPLTLQYNLSFNLMRHLAKLLFLVITLTVPDGLLAQDLRNPVLTIDIDQFFGESAFGKRIALEIEERRRALGDENRRLQTELEIEERKLTAQRAELTPQEFRELADAFDNRVQTIRREREVQGRAMNDQLEENRIRFLNTAAPVLEGIMKDSGAQIILERGVVFISTNVIDITAIAIKQIDAVLGDGLKDAE